MKLSILAGSTSESINVFVADSSSTTGAGLTGLVFNSAGLVAYYSHSGTNATATAITLATLAAVSSAYSSGGFKEIDSTNMPGWYRLDLPNAVLAASKGRCVAVHLKGATNMAPLPIEIELTGWNNQDGVRAGLTALPNVASGSAGAIVTSGTGTAQLSTSSGQVLLQTGTGTGQLDFTSGVVKANVTQLLGTAWLTPGTAGTPDVNTKTIGPSAIDAGAFASGAIHGTAMAASAIRSDVFQANSITASALAADAGTEIGTAVWATTTRVLTAGTNIVLPSNGLSSVTAWTVDITGNLSGSVGSVTGLNASDVSAIKAKTDNLPAAPAAVSDIPTAAVVADAVWDEATSGHVTAGTTGAAIIAAGSAGDPWSTSLPGAYGAGTAGYIVGNRIDVALSSLATAANLATLTGYVDTEVAAIKAKTDLIPAAPAAVGDIPTATENADALLLRNFGALTVTNTRCALNALRFLRNKWSLSGTTLTVTAEDDSTAAWTATVTTDAGATPITGSDPA